VGIGSEHATGTSRHATGTVVMILKQAYLGHFLRSLFGSLAAYFVHLPAENAIQDDMTVVMVVKFRYYRY
jgi:hypothetical protein